MSKSWVNTTFLFNVLSALLIALNVPLVVSIANEKLESRRRINECKIAPITDANERPVWQSLPIEIGIDESVPFQAEAAIRDAAGKWEAVLGQPVFVFHASRGVKLEQDFTSVIYWNTGEYQQPTEQQAVTKSNWYGPRIYDADIVVNAHNFTLSVGHSLVPNAVDLESLMIHELGHVLGIGHITNGGTMNPKLPSAHDRRLVDTESSTIARCLYADKITPTSAVRSLASTITDTVKN